MAKQIEKKVLETIETLKEMSEEDINQIAKLVSTLIRALEGKPPESGDVITRFTNVGNLLERSRFPTYPIVGEQEYLRLIDYVAKKRGSDEAEACKQWADFEAEALISYKGLSRQEYTEQLKHATGAREETRFYFGERAPPVTVPQKKGFFSRFRKPSKEETEFVAQ